MRTRAAAGAPGAIAASPSGSDDTSAFQSYLTAAALAGGGLGGAVQVNPGLWKFSGSLSVPSNVRIVCAGKGSTVFRKTANIAGGLLSFTGASNATRCQRGGVSDVRLEGNGFTGPLLAGKWADHLNFDRVWFLNNPDVMFDFENVWDTYFTNCEYDTAIGADGFKPAGLITGNADDSSNIIVFNGCRWENFVDGALWVGARRPSSAYSLPTGTNPPYGIFLTNCKMETPQLRGYMFNESADIQAVHMDGMYVAARGLAAGVSTGRTLFNVIGAGDHTFRRIRAQVSGVTNPSVDRFFSIFTNARISIRDLEVNESQAINTAVIAWDGGTPDFDSGNLHTTNMGKLFGGGSGNLSQPTIASAATTMAVPRWQKVVHVSGTAAITAIPALAGGRDSVTLDVTAAATIADAGNLKLSSAFTGPGQISMWCDGTNWIEDGRSIN